MEQHPPAAPPAASFPRLVAVLGVMALLAVAMTWPLAQDLAHAVNDYYDPLLNSWILWWDWKALTTPGLSLFNAPIFHPAPLTLAYSEHLIVSALTAAPVLALGGDAILAHNVVFLLSFAFCGLGGWLLGWQLTGSRGAAWICGLGFAFAPFRFGQLGHLQMETAHFMPWVLLYLHRWADQPRWSWALGFGLCWLLQILSCGYYAMFVSLAVGLFLLYHGLLEGWWRDKRRWLQLAAVCLGVALLVAPFFLPYAQVKKQFGFVRSPEQAAGFAATLRGYLAAPPANLLYGRLTTDFRKPEGELFLGLVLSALALGGLVSALRRRAGQAQAPDRSPGAAPVGGRAASLKHLARQPAMFYGLLALVALWTSLGPHWGLYALFYEIIPGFDALRVPARLAVLVTLAWAVLAGLGWQALEGRWSSRPRRARAALLGACLLILLESCSVPLPLRHIYDFTPEVYQWLAKQPQGTVVMEVPAMWNMGDEGRDARYLYWSTKHGQVLVNGYSGFFPPGYRQFTALADNLPDTSKLLPALRQKGARYLVLHLKEYPRARQAGLLEGLRRDPGLREAFASQWDYAFEILAAPGQGG